MNCTMTIYAITNTVTGRVYVGRTYRPLKWRVHEHMKLLKRGRHKNRDMQYDFDKYGERFEVTTLETAVAGGKCFGERNWMKALKTYDRRYGYNSSDPAAKTLRKEAGLYVKPSPLKGRKRN